MPAFSGSSVMATTTVSSTSVARFSVATAFLDRCWIEAACKGPVNCGSWYTRSVPRYTFRVRNSADRCESKPEIHGLVSEQSPLLAVTVRGQEEPIEIPTLEENANVGNSASSERDSGKWKGKVMKQEHFRSWCLGKIRELGPLAIEDMNSTFWPEAQRLDRVRELSKWKTKSGIFGDLPGSRKGFLGAGISETSGAANGLSLKGTRQITKPVDINRMYNMTEKKRIRRKRFTSRNYEEKESDRGWHPELCTYETEFAKQQALYFYNMFAFPWEKGAFERFVDKLERKYFPDDLIDFEINPKDKNKKTVTKKAEAKDKNSVDTKAEEKPKTAHGMDAKPSTASEGLRTSKRSTESSQRSTDTVNSAGTSTQSVGPDSGGFIESEPLESVSSSCQISADDWQPVSDTSRGSYESVESLWNEKPETESFGFEPTEQIVAAKPLVLTRSMKLPETWDGPMGTVVLIDKPTGWTSFTVCGRLRKLIKVEKVGHAGTLDPLATGLLVVCVGKATKLTDSYQAMTKVYSGTMRLGEGTPSYDCDTSVSERLPWEHITDEDVQRAKQEFVGDIMQVPPIFSALKVEGERLYKKARRGEEFQIPPRMVSINEFHIERSSGNRQDFEFKVVCSKGTYIRSLCYDLGRALNTCAHLTCLRREKIGHMSVEDAWSFPELTERYTADFL